MRSDRFAAVALTVTALTGAALAVALPTPAPAQTVTDDVRCLLLSTGYTRAAKEEGTRRTAAMTGVFFLGRLSGRLTDPAVAAAIKAQGTGMPAAQAAPIMRACAARAAAAEQTITTITRDAQHR